MWGVARGALPDEHAPRATDARRATGDGQRPDRATTRFEKLIFVQLLSHTSYIEPGTAHTKRQKTHATHAHLYTHTQHDGHGT